MMRTLPILTESSSHAHADPPVSRGWVMTRFLRDLKNILQSQIALRYRRAYLPSLFGHYSVNSVCNLRCSYCYIAQPEIAPSGFTLRGLPLDRAKRVLLHLRQEAIALRLLGGEPLLQGPSRRLAPGPRDDTCW